MARSTFRCSHVSHRGLCLKNSGSASLITSASSREGRPMTTPSGFDWTSELRQLVQGVDQVLHVLVGKVNVESGLLEVIMAEQLLDDTEVGPSVVEMRGEAMPESMGVDRFPNPGTFGRVATRVPNDFI